MTPSTRDNTCQKHELRRKLPCLHYGYFFTSNCSGTIWIFHQNVIKYYMASLMMNKLLIFMRFSERSFFIFDKVTANYWCLAAFSYVAAHGPIS